MKFVLPAATTAERLTITPDSGELIYNETDNTVYLGDSTTLGGVKLLTSTTSISGTYVSKSGDSMSGQLTLNDVGAINSAGLHLNNQSGTQIVTIGAGGGTGVSINGTGVSLSSISGGIAGTIVTQTAGLLANSGIKTSDLTLTSTVAAISAGLQSQITQNYYDGIAFNYILSH
jgi:hypothetical protein